MSETPEVSCDMRRPRRSEPTTMTSELQPATTRQIDDESRREMSCGLLVLGRLSNLGILPLGIGQLG